MKKTTTGFVIIGGDKRQKFLAKNLQKENYNLLTYAEWTKSPGAEVVIGPVPCSVDGIHFYNENPDEKIVMQDVFKKISDSKNKIFIAGAISKKARADAEQLGVTVIDLMEMDEVAIKNAIPTAEGVVKVAIENSDITLMNSEVLVLGYGRCGKVLANMLSGMGAKVTVTHRNGSAMIEAFGLNAVHLNDFEKEIQKYDFIINTIPTLLITSDTLNKMKKETLIIDIATSPGGVDFEYAKEKNIKALLCPGLPGKVAPRTAAHTLFFAIQNFLEEYFNSIQ